MTSDTRPTPQAPEGDRPATPPEGAAPGPVAATAAIACESTACLPDELVRRYGIEVIPVPLVFGDQTYYDGVTISQREFYARLDATHTPPRTSPPSPGDYLEAWRRMAARAPAVAQVTASGRITSFQRSTRLAESLAAEALPGVPLAVVDSGSAAMGQGFVALAAARAAAAGLPFAEVVRRAEAVSRRVQMVVTLDTLEYLARASRIPQVAAFVGGVLAIKPILLFQDGDVRQLARVRTRRRSVEQLFEEVRARLPVGRRAHVAVHHTQAEPEAQSLADRLRAACDPAELFVTEFTPVMGAYCGPGLLAVAFYAEAGDDGGEAGDDGR